MIDTSNHILGDRWAYPVVLLDAFDSAARQFDNSYFIAHRFLFWRDQVLQTQEIWPGEWIAWKSEIYSEVKNKLPTAIAKQDPNSCIHSLRFQWTKLYQPDASSCDQNAKYLCSNFDNHWCSISSTFGGLKDIVSG